MLTFRGDSYLPLLRNARIALPDLESDNGTTGEIQPSIQTPVTASSRQPTKLDYLIISRRDVPFVVKASLVTWSREEEGTVR